MLTEKNVYNWLLFARDILPEIKDDINSFINSRFSTKSTYRISCKKRNVRLYKEFFK